jgi:GAF domain-containing protein/two-component sensor histidine kinase
MENDTRNPLHELARVLTTVREQGEWFNACRHTLRSLVSCDLIVFFFTDPDSNDLIAPYAYNIIPNNLFTDYTISLRADSDFNAVIKERETVKRVHSETPVFGGMSSELFSPIASPDAVLGGLYLARETDTPFKEEDQEVAEQVAAYLVAPFERMGQTDKLEKKQEIGEYWREHYLHLMNALPFPCATQDIDTNTFQDVNDEFLTLVQLDREQLAGKTVDQLVPSLPDRSETGPVRVSGEVLTAFGESVELDILSSAAQSGDRPYRLLIFLPLGQRTVKGDTETVALELLSFVSHIDWHSTVFREELKTVILAILKKLDGTGIILDWDQDESLSLSVDKQPVPETTIEWLMRVTDPGVNAHQSRFVQDAYTQLSEPTDRETAEALHCRSFAVVPLVRQQDVTGRLIFFSDREQAWSESKQNQFYVSVYAVEFVLRLMEQESVRDQLYGQIRALFKIAGSVISNTDLPALVEELAGALRTVVSFDYFSLSLLNSRDQSTSCYDLATNEAKAFLPQTVHLDLGEGEMLGWIRGTQETPIKLRRSRLPFSLPSHTSVLLLDGERYQGNLALGRVDDLPFDSESIRFLKQLTALLTAWLASPTPTQERVGPLQQFLNASWSAFESRNVEHLLKSIKTVAEMFFELSSCVLVEADDPLTVIPGRFRSEVDAVKLVSWNQRWETRRQPEIINTFDQFREVFGSEGQSRSGDVKTEIVPVAILPLFNRSGVCTAFLRMSRERPFEPWEGEVMKWLGHQLQVSLDKAEGVHHDMEQLRGFTATVIHDLKTPLQSIKSFLSLLFDEGEDDDSERREYYIQRVRSNVDHLESFVQDLLAGYQTDFESLQSTPCDLNEVIKDALEAVVPGEVEVNVSPDLPTWRANRLEIKHVFVNLFTNAVEAMKEQKNPRLEIGLMPPADIYIRDNGCGMDPEQQKSLFKRSVTQQNQTDTSHHGMGLASVKRMVQKYGGEIRVESEPETGTMVVIRLPQSS